MRPARWTAARRVKPCSEEEADDDAAEREGFAEEALDEGFDRGVDEHDGEEPVEWVHGCACCGGLRWARTLASMAGSCAFHRSQL